MNNRFEKLIINIDDTIISDGSIQNNEDLIEGVSLTTEELEFLKGSACKFRNLERGRERLRCSLPCAKPEDEQARQKLLQFHNLYQKIQVGEATIDDINAWRQNNGPAQFGKVTAACLYAAFEITQLSKESQEGIQQARKNRIQKYLDILKENNENLILDGFNLSGVDLSGLQFPKSTSFIGTNLLKANFANCDLLEVNFRQACLKEARFQRANLMFASLEYSNCTKADFTGATLKCIRATEAELNQAIFDRAKLQGAELLTSRNIEHASFQGAKLDFAVLTRSQHKHIRKRKIGDKNIQLGKIGRLYSQLLPILSSINNNFHSTFKDEEGRDKKVKKPINPNRVSQKLISLEINGPEEQDLVLKKLYTENEYKRIKDYHKALQNCYERYCEEKAKITFKDKLLNFLGREVESIKTADAKFANLYKVYKELKLLQPYKRFEDEKGQKALSLILNPKGIFYDDEDSDVGKDFLKLKTKLPELSDLQVYQSTAAEFRQKLKAHQSVKIKEKIEEKIKELGRELSSEEIQEIQEQVTVECRGNLVEQNVGEERKPDKGKAVAEEREVAEERKAGKGKEVAEESKPDNDVVNDNFSSLEGKRYKDFETTTEFMRKSNAMATIRSREKLLDIQFNKELSIRLNAKVRELDRELSLKEKKDIHAQLTCEYNQHKPEDIELMIAQRITTQSEKLSAEAAKLKRREKYYKARTPSREIYRAVWDGSLDPVLESLDSGKKVRCNDGSLFQVQRPPLSSSSAYEELVERHRPRFSKVILK